jgi:hypothetical protein
MVSLSIGDGAGARQKFKKRFRELATKDFFSADVLLLEYATFKLANFPT